jgi:hypothetical protein
MIENAHCPGESTDSTDIMFSLDNRAYKSKPKGSEIGQISYRIAKNKEVIKSNEDIGDFAENVGNQGHTFCPATFRNGTRNQDNFKQMQFLTLDFDGGISLMEIKSRAEYLYLPILLAYETLTSIEQNKFRVVFLNDVPITDSRLAKISLDALMTIFPEADKSCKDIAKMFFGEKNFYILIIGNSTKIT